MPARPTPQEKAETLAWLSIACADRARSTSPSSASAWSVRTTIDGPSILKKRRAAVIAVSDYMHAVQDQIRPWIPRRYATLGADGFGFSDTRAAVQTVALDRLRRQGPVDESLLGQRLERAHHDRRAVDLETGNAGGES
jgi:hypothetical protein